MILKIYQPRLKDLRVGDVIYNVPSNKSNKIESIMVGISYTTFLLDNGKQLMIFDKKLKNYMLIRKIDIDI